MNSKEYSANTKIIDFFCAPHIRINKEIIDIYDAPTALWFGDIYSRWHYFDNKNKSQDGFFYVSQEKIYESTKLDRKKQTKIIQQLSADGAISIKRKGIPARNWYRINLHRISEIIYNKNNNIENEIDANVLPARCPTSDILMSNKRHLDVGNKDILMSQNETSKRNKNKTNKNKTNKVLLHNTTISKNEMVDNDILEILSFWNKLPHTTKHKIDPKSKTFKSISSRLKNMLLGLPIENKNKDGSLNKVFQKFLHENNIPEEIYLKKWDTNKITNIFQIINDANSNKNKLSMDTVLWNYFAGGRATGYSHFLYTANNLDISEKNDEHKELTVLFMDAIGKKDIEFSKQIQCDHAFYAMIESGIDILELRNVILWYKAHKNDKYTPKAHDVQEFRDKYDRILEAKNRDEEPSSQTNIRRRRQAPVKTKNAEHTKESLHLFEHEDLNENLKLYNSLVDYCVNKRDIWGGEIKPDKDIIFEAIMALKQFMNNLTEYDPYHWNSIDIIFRNYIDYIDEESWINRLSTHSPLFPDFSTFEDFTKWYHGNGVRSRGWGEDIDLPMLSASEILIKRNDDKEAKENDKQEKESSAQRINDLTIFMHNSMRERLTKISDTQIEKIELDCWTKQDDNKELREEFIEFVDEVEKEHLSNPIQRNKSYPHLFRLKNTES